MIHPFLYHGSPNKDITRFEPRVSGGSGEKYGALVYATPDIATASIFLAFVSGSWNAGRFGDIRYALIPMSREQFITQDVGGCIYVLPGEGFETDPERGMGEFEWANPHPVIPVRKIEYTSALDAMIEYNVQVYFVDKEIYEKIQKMPDHGYSILQGLQSENQHRKRNVLIFE